jgi:UDP-N-acetylglucosamine 2-epimerase (non-hydrolysing)
LVHGDTTTTFAAALAAFYRGVPIAHVEAGLRTYNILSPYPEEFNRRAVSLMTTMHFAPTERAAENLIREGVERGCVFITGNTVVDALRITLTEKRPLSEWSLPPDKRILLFTAHRRESFGPPIRGMLRALRRIVEDTPDLLAFFPVHHNPEVRRAAIEILKGVPRIRMIEPPEIVSFHHLLSKAYLILTDSGGIQEEASALGIPTIVMRYSSERTEGMRAGVLKLAGSGEEGIVTLAKRLLEPDSEEYASMHKPSAIYGDGNASVRIADILESKLQ